MSSILDRTDRRRIESLAVALGKNACHLEDCLVALMSDAFERGTEAISFDDQDEGYVDHQSIFQFECEIRQEIQSVLRGVNA